MRPSPCWPLSSNIFSHVGSKSEPKKRPSKTSCPAFRQIYDGIGYPHLSRSIQKIFRKPHRIRKFYAGKLFSALVFSATWSCIQMLYTDFSASPRTGLWYFRGLPAVPPVWPYLDSALLFTRLSIAPAIRFLPLSAIESVHSRCLGFPTTYRKSSSYCGPTANGYPRFAHRDVSAILSRASDTRFALSS